jgi:putative ABC transport system permease protein
MNGLLLDLKVAMRRLTRRSDGAAVFVITLALGLTSAATATGIVRSLLWRPLPFSTLDRLMLVRDDVPVTGVEQRDPVTPADVAALRNRGSAFEHVAAFRFRTRTLGAGTEAEQMHVAETSANFWQALDVRAAIGRTFGPEEETPGRDGVVVLSDIFWRDRLGGAPVLGRSLLIDGRPFSVIGVATARYPLAVDAWIPLALSPAALQDLRTRSLQVVALLKPGVTSSAAEADARRVAASLAAEHPDTHRGRSFRILALRAEQYEFTLSLFSIVQIVALGVLVVAVANAVTIMGVKVMDGRPEAAVRAALGADILRVVRPFVLEATILSAAAGGLAIVLARWALPLVRRGIPPGIAKWVAGWDAIQLDLPLAVVTWCAATLIGVAVGIWSGVRGVRGRLSATIALGGRAAVGVPGRSRQVVLGLQTAVSVVLLTAAVLFGSGLRGVGKVLHAYDPDRVLLARTTAAPHRFTADDDVVAFFDRSIANAGALPGVRVAGLIRNAPASNVSNPTSGVWPVEAPPAKGTRPPTADVQIADPNGLAAIGVPIVRGRSFASGDTAQAARVALVSRQLATRLWGDRDPLGRRLAIEGGTESEIVGVVEDIQLNWYDGGPRPTVYLPHAQTAARGMTFVLRTSVSPAVLSAPLAAAVRRAADNPPPLRIYTLRDEVDDALAPLRTLAWLLVALAGIAFALSAAGIYGVAASAVALRVREMGIRIVLGAAPRSLVGLVLRVAVRPVAAGCLIGVPAAAVLASWLESHTFGLLALAPTVPVGIAALLLAAAAGGAWIPSRRATRVDPIVALRE